MIDAGIDTSAIRELRRLANRQLNDAPAAVGGEERCDLCSAVIPADHRHMLHVEERQIVCTCETCRALFAGDGPYKPTGSRTVWLDGLELPDDLWASFRIPIGLAFFFESSSAGGVVAFYPSPAGTTECELDLRAWETLVAANPMLEGLEPDAEALIVNRLGGARQHAIVPIDECYRLVGLVRVSWEGISGGTQIEGAVSGFFAELREKAA
ncbi:MAG: DUF5947 family protein [Thermoleophilia bacterium]